ncbi:MAG: MFS transporter [Acidobacteria bacterium]|nr:MFS transporter [Acidobacteriota bacterium]
MKRLPRAIILLGLVSFFTDLSSEMIYPLLPLFLTTVLGAGAAALGLIEGVAESAAALLKVVSGIWTDRVSRRKPFILVGYGLAGLVRPLIGLARSWPFVMFIRFADRVGKGLRTSPRDALIADITEPALRGRAFGFHRAMDHAGAVLGPLVAAGLLAVGGVSLRQVFLLSAIPAIIVIALVAAGVRESPVAARVSARPAARPGSWPELGDDFKFFLLALILFTLGNSSDAFLLLRLSAAGISATQIASLWSLHHVIKLGATYTGGSLSDRLGRRSLILAGWFVYAVIYGSFALAHSRSALIIIFLAYGLYYGLTEPAERAWVADLVPERLRGTAFGFYHGAIGLASLPASLLFGLLWQTWGAPVAFLSGAMLAALASALLLRVRPGG